MRDSRMMRTKKLVIILGCIVLTSVLFIIFGPGQQNDSFKNIVSQTHQQLKELQVNLRVAEVKKFQIDPKYLTILGFENVQEETAPATLSAASSTFSSISTTIPRTGASIIRNNVYNGTKLNFTIVTYVQSGEMPAAVLLTQNIANKIPNENLLIYDLGLNADESRILSGFCNSSKCTVICYDLTVFPSYVADKRMIHAYRPIVIKDALMRSKNILFTENYIRLNGTSHDLNDLKVKSFEGSGILGWTIPTAVSTRTHPKMFDYFQSDAEDFIFLRMMDLDAVFFSDFKIINDNILLPWIKCALTLECLDPIGAQSNGCKYNKKPQYRYSGCHAYDASAFNIVLGITWHMDESKYSIPKETSTNNYIFYKQTLAQSLKIWENKRRNITDTSEHPFTDD